MGTWSGETATESVVAVFVSVDALCVQLQRTRENKIENEMKDLKSFITDKV